jgi:organic hydroperoxide reductase OsmC/OhrA
MENVCFYDVSLKWEQGCIAEIASSKVNQTLKINGCSNSPREISARWSAEHLLLGALCSCYMTSFIDTAEKAGLRFQSFGCDILGRVENIEDQLIFTEVILKPVVKILNPDDLEKTNKILERAQRDCIIANSLNFKIQRFAVINIAEELITV